VTCSYLLVLVLVLDVLEAAVIAWLATRAAPTRND